MAQPLIFQGVKYGPSTFSFGLTACQEVKVFSQRCRSMEVEVAEVAALQFTLREMEMNADVVQQRLEQSQCFGYVFLGFFVGVR